MRPPASVPLFDEVPVPRGACSLVLAPHPDDFDAIGVTLRLLHERGHAIHLFVATSGASGVDDADCTPPTTETKAALREREQRASCALFGLPEERLAFLHLATDEGGHPAVESRNIAAVRALLTDVQPALVFLPHGHDTSIGHQRVYALLRAAATEAPPFTACLNRDPKTIAMRYDVVTPYGEEPAAWKATLLRCHESQHRRNLRRRGSGFAERILAMDRATAAECGLREPYAEVFELERLPAPASAAPAPRVDTPGATG